LNSFIENGAEKGPAELIAIALVARPQGIRGEVVADLLTDFPERFAQRKQVWLGKSEADARVVELEQHRLHQGRVLLKFKGCDTRDDAELLRGQRVMIPREALAALPPDEFFYFDLIGCALVMTEGQTLGVVNDVQDYGAAPLLVTEIAGREVMIPLAGSICTEIDTAHKRIVVALPEGLLDL
jgi:16S rRNA processing protein RimM